MRLRGAPKSGRIVLRKKRGTVDVVKVAPVKNGRPSKPLYVLLFGRGQARSGYVSTRIVLRRHGAFDLLTRLREALGVLR